MTWTKVCEKSDIPEGSIKKVWARIGGGIPIAVAHHKRGFVAMPPVCPHLEEPLEESGLVMGCKLTCTKHLWSWDLETLELQDEAELPLKTSNDSIWLHSTLYLLTTIPLQSSASGSSQGTSGNVTYAQPRAAMNCLTVTLVGGFGAKAGVIKEEEYANGPYP